MTSKSTNSLEALNKKNSPITSDILTDVLEALNKNGLATTPDELADGFWLAAYYYNTSTPLNAPHTTTLSSNENTPDKDPNHRSSPHKSEPTANSESTQKAIPEPKPNKPDASNKEQLSERKPAVDKPSGEIYPQTTDQSKIQIKGHSIHIPQAPVLPAMLEFERALRPFGHKKISRNTFEIDEIETAEFIANTGIWSIIKRPTKERWLEGVVVIEQSPTMRMWQDTGRELYKLFWRSGSFHWLKLAYLREENEGLSLISHFGCGPSQNVKSIIQPNTKRVIFLCTDCLSNAWLDGKTAEAIDLWARHHPTILLQMLPEYMWPRTSLRNANFLSGGSLNPATHPVPTQPELQTNQQEPLIPIISARPDAFADLAQFLIAGPHNKVLCYRNHPADFQEYQTTEPTQEINSDDDDDVFKQFLESAAPQTIDLARFLASAPLFLPIMRLVQYTLVQDSEPANLAELFNSGILYRRSPGAPTDHPDHPDHIEYDFVGKVRGYLLNQGSIPRIQQVWPLLDSYINNHFGRGGDFCATLRDPTSHKTFGAGLTLEAGHPFTRVFSEVLRWMGGDYSNAIASAFYLNAPKITDANIPLTIDNTHQRTDNISHANNTYTIQPKILIKIFISYSHDSDAHRARVLAFAQALRTHGIDADLDQFHGETILDWPSWCREKMEREASDFVLCVCTAEYKRRIHNHVRPEQGKGVYWEGSLIQQELYDEKGNRRFIPVLFDDEAESSIVNIFRNWTYCRIAAFELTDSGYELLLRILTGRPSVVPEKFRSVPMLGTTPLHNPPALSPRPAAALPPLGAAVDKAAIDLTHLPKAIPDFLGRSTELAALNAAWADTGKTRVLVLVAPGGTGKSSLVRRWLNALDHDDWRGAQQVFGWSFYSQGSDDSRQASEEPFFAAALPFFGLTLAETASVHDKAAALVKAMRARRTLLVLDGLEPLQYPPGPMGGQLKAKGIEALLQALIDSGHPGLCVVTTREALTDIAGHVRTAEDPHGSAQQIDLGNLCAADGARLLHKLGVTRAGAAEIGPNDAELLKASEAVQGHALTLRILGLYLTAAHHGDVRRLKEVDFAAADREFQTDPDRPYGHAFAAMCAYEHWLAGGSERNRRQLTVLTLLGLFDRPATPDCLRALRDPPIPGLTDGLTGIGDGEWKLLIADLEKAGLVQTAEWQPGKVEGYGEELAQQFMETWDAERKRISLGPPQAFTPPGPPLPAGARSLDAHPLLREYFARRLSDSTDPAEREAARAGHARLYEHLCASVPYWPEGEAGLAPLYQAVAHGCQAGRYAEACDVYGDRINRRAEAYATKRLGLYGTELAALASFFAPPWRTPVMALAEGERAWLLHEAAFRLHALGRLREAVEPMRAGLEMGVAQQNWKEAARRASNLSELLLTLGEVREAEAEAARAIGYADDSGDAFQRMSKRTTHADAGLQAGAPAAALARFAEAEALQRQQQPEYPRLYSAQGFRYCDALLLGAERTAWAARLGAALPGALCAARLAEAQAVAQRAAQTLDWAINHFRFGPLPIGLDHLTLARAALYRAWLAAPGEAGAAASAGAEATHAAAQAVEWLRKAGANQFLPHGLLTRACVHALHGNVPAARADLNEAERIARRGDMRLHLADVHLHRARLFLDSDPAAARTDLNEARRLIDATGYERRRGELDDATAVLEGRAVVLPETESMLAAIRGEHLPEPPAAASPP